MADKLFYSYNSPWINNNSITYTEKYSYALIVNPKNHILAYNGKDYGVFHNENYISCIPQSNFINTSNIVTSQSTTSICIKIPSNPHTIWTVTSGTTGAGSPANHSLLDLIPEASDRLSFDLSVGSSLYHISAILNSTIKSKKFWSNCNVVKLSNSNTNNNINFGYYRTSASTNSNLSTHSYLPYISISGFQGVGIPVSIYNLSFSSNSSNGFNTVNYPYLNYIDNDKKTSYMWQIKLGTSSTYFIDTTITPAQMIPNGKIQQHNIWGQAFDGTGNVQGNLTIASYSHGGTTEKGILKANYVNVNCDDTSNQLAVAGTGVISNTTYLCSGGGNSYIGVSNTNTDARLNNGALQAKLYVNGITYVSKLNVNSKYKSGNGFSAYIQGDTRLQGILYVNDSLQNVHAQAVFTNKPVATVNLSYAGRVEVLASQASGIGLYNRTASHTNATTSTIGTGGRGNWWIIRDAYLGPVSGDMNNKTWRTVLGEGTNVGIGTSYPRAKLHVSGSTYIGGTPSGVQPMLYTNGTNFLNGNTGIGIAPSGSYRLYVSGKCYITGDTGIGVAPSNSNYRLYVSGRTYLNGNVGIGIAPDTGSTYRLKIDGSSSHLSTLFSNGKIILNDENTWIQRNGLNVDTVAGKGIINMISTPSTFGVSKILQAHATTLSGNTTCNWNLGFYYYDNNSSNTDNYLKCFYGSPKTTGAGRINIYYNPFGGGYNLLLYYTGGETGSPASFVNYIFRSSYNNKLAFWDLNFIPGYTYINLDYYQYTNETLYSGMGPYILHDAWGSFGGYVATTTGNVYNIVCLGVIIIYKYWSWPTLDDSNAFTISPDYSEYRQDSSGTLTEEKYKINEGTNTHVVSSGLLKFNDCGGFKKSWVQNNHGTIKFTCSINPVVSGDKKNIHISSVIAQLETIWSAASTPTPIVAGTGNLGQDGWGMYDIHCFTIKHTNNTNEVHIQAYAMKQHNDTNSSVDANGFNTDRGRSVRTFTVSIFGWLF